MKREPALIFASVLVLSIIFSAGFASALDFEMSKTSYYPGETLQVEFYNVFIDTLKISNVLIYAKGSVHNSPAESGILKYDNNYHFYAVLPTAPGEYELVIEGARYWDGSVQSDAPIRQPFTIVSTNESYLSFDPGYVYTSSSFSVSIKAYNKDKEITIELPEINFKKTTTMGYGDSKTIFFPVSELEETVESNIKVGEYEIPVTILSAPSTPVSTTPTTPSEGDQSLKDLVASDTEEITGTILPGVDYYYQIVIVNKNENVKNIKLTSSDSDLKVSPEFIASLYKENIINITLNTEGDFDGFIKLETESSAMTIPVHLKIAENNEELSTNIPTTTEDKTCAKLGGIICAGKEKCTSSRTASIDSTSGNCCIDGGECKIPSNSSLYWILGVLLLIALIIGAWFLYSKASKGESSDYLNKIFAKKTQQYQRRMNPQSENTEVRRSLSRM